MIEIINILILPLIGPLSLYFFKPQSDLGEIMAFLGWPVFYFLAGLVYSSFDQPKIAVDKLGEEFVKLKWKAHNLRIAWMFFLLLFEAFSAMCILAGGEGMPLAFFLIPVGLYIAYAALCLWRLNCLKSLRQQGR